MEELPDDVFTLIIPACAPLGRFALLFVNRRLHRLVLALAPRLGPSPLFTLASSLTVPFQHKSE